MPRLYLREAEPFLPSDQKLKMEENIRAHPLKGSSKRTDRATQRHFTSRTTSLIISDATVLVIEMLQILALIQSMSLKWSWPQTWTKYANFIFIFNADAWEFIKVHSGAYTRLQGVETASSKVPANYNHILIAWGIFLLVVGLAFLMVYLILQRRQPPYLMVHHARMERVLLIIAQVVTIPLGTVVFRLFHCTGAGNMAVFNTVKCHEGLYWAYFVPALLVIILLFGVVPVWMVYRIRSQKLAAATRHHEDYMKLKEVEYMAGLDVIWAVQGFHLFSSFRLPAAYYRPIVQWAKLILLIIFAAAFPYIYNQAITLAVFLSLYAIAVPLIRPFRVTSFNVVLGLSLGCLAGDSVFGAVITSVTPATVESPWLVEPYSYWILIAINGIMASILLTWLVFMAARRFCCNKCYPNDPLWPVLLSYAYEVNGMETYKFMAAVLRGRAVLDTCIRAPSVFAPVHHLARQIEIINAFCREAEKTKDGTHSTLLHLLDDMTDVYRRLEPVSLFADTVHESIRQNAAKFVQMMPAFTHRLAQRDYDLILVHPLKKRMLLKMSIIGMFVNGRRQRPVKNPLTQNALHKIWEELPDIVDPREEVEYQEDLYPGPLTGPDTETLYMAGTVDRPLELMDLDDSDEEESLAAFLGRVPPILVMKDEESRRGSRSSENLIVTDLEANLPSTSGSTTVPESSTVFVVQETGPGSNTHMETEQPGLGHSAEAGLSETGFVNPAFVPDEDDQEAEITSEEGLATMSSAENKTAWISEFAGTVRDVDAKPDEEKVDEPVSQKIPSDEKDESSSESGHVKEADSEDTADIKGSVKDAVGEEDGREREPDMRADTEVMSAGEPSADDLNAGVERENLMTESG